MNEKFTRIIREKQDNYLLIVVSIESVKTIICFKQGHFTYYAKIVLEKDLESLDCREAILSPYGLYVFSSKIEDLVDKIAGKAKILVSRSTSS